MDTLDAQLMHELKRLTTVTTVSNSSSTAFSAAAAEKAVPMTLRQENPFEAGKLIYIYVLYHINTCVCVYVYEVQVLYV